MPANLPPKYYEAEQKYRAARSPDEKAAALQQMLSATPKHKGTDHIRADLRARVARALEESEQPRAGAGRRQTDAIRKEGAGQAVLLGMANAGKSQLLASLTGASAKVASYPFTTQLPLPGMLRFQNVRIQLVDTPALDDQAAQPRLFSLLRNADLWVIVVDLSADPLTELEEIISEMDRYGFQLLDKDEPSDPEDDRVQKQVVLVANKADSEGADDASEFLEELYGHRFSIVAVSAAQETGLDQLADAIFTALAKVRVYLKARGSQPDYDDPLVLDQGSMVEHAALSLHKDWTVKVKYALLWGSGKFGGQRVGREYVLADGDVIELHA